MKASKAGAWVGPLGGVLAVLVPKGICPICLATSGSILPAIGLGFLAEDGVMRWLLPIVLLFSLLAFFVSARNRERWIPFALAATGCLFVYLGWFFTASVLLYGGTGLLVFAVLANLRKPREDSTVPIT